jgi:O-antigen/teichoic acid export membrane protein
LKPFDDDSGTFLPPAAAIRQLAVRGAGATILSSGLGVAIQMVSTMILARLLTPADFGLVTMVTTFSLLLVSFGVNGFTEAIIQWEEVDHALASNLFWINLATGILFALGFSAAGSLMARFYHTPVVGRIAVGMSLTILASSMSVLHLALLNRAMLFTAISTNDVIARAVSLIVAILLALAGWGYWALVAGAVALPVSQSIGAWYLCRWIPGLPRRNPGTSSAVRFAMNIYGRFTVNYGSRNLDNLLVGWRFAAQALGFYKKAYDLFALSAGQLVGPLSNVALAALSRVSRDSVQYRKHLLNILALIAFVGMGLGAELTLVGKDVIRLLLGPGWEASGRIFTYFGPGIGIMFLYSTHGWIHLSLGKADRWFRWGVVEFIVTGLLFILGLRRGPAGVALAWTASFWILTIPAFWYAGRPIQLRVGSIVAAAWKYVLASAIAGSASALIIRTLPSLVAASGTLEAALHIVIVSLLFGILYLSAVIFLHHGCAPLYQFARVLREMVPWERFRKSTLPSYPGVEPEPLAVSQSRE